MPNRRLTQSLIDALDPDGSVRDVRDTELRGFGVRIMPSGRKSYFVHAQSGMQRRWTKLGDARTLPLARARTLARARLAALRNRDPSRAPEAAAETPFEVVAKAAFRRHARLWNPGTMEINRHCLKHQILPPVTACSGHPDSTAFLPGDLNAPHDGNGEIPHAETDLASTPLKLEVSAHSRLRVTSPTCAITPVPK